MSPVPSSVRITEERTNSSVDIEGEKLRKHLEDEKTLAEQLAKQFQHCSYSLVTDHIGQDSHGTPVISLKMASVPFRTPERMSKSIDQKGKTR